MTYEFNDAHAAKLQQQMNAVLDAAAYRRLAEAERRARSGQHDDEFIWKECHGEVSHGGPSLVEGYSIDDYNTWK